MAQFVILPPASLVAGLFIDVTGKPLSAGVTWTDCRAISAGRLEPLRPYVRPCHRSLLDRTAAGGSPLPFLRQLLRPYGYRIEASGESWMLIGPEGTHVGHTAGHTVQWD